VPTQINDPGLWQGDDFQCVNKSEQ
jgi:hypothetical protein